MNTVSAVSSRSPWHSPVPYLFGGLAAMLGLIAFALLILACSYWKLSSYLENDNPEDHDLELGEGHDDRKKSEVLPKCKESVLVIMAGQENPTCLATPVSRSNPSFKCSCSGDEATNKVVRES